MEIKELRIGNVVALTDVAIMDYYDTTEEQLVKEQVITALSDDNSVLISDAYGFFDLKEFEPVLLTEEWLLKLGFTRAEWDDSVDGKAYLAPNVAMTVYWDDNKVKVSFWYGVDYRYVHHFQNFYYGLSRIELI